MVQPLALAGVKESPARRAPGAKAIPGAGAGLRGLIRAREAPMVCGWMHARTCRSCLSATDRP